MAWACVLLPSLAFDGALRHRAPVGQPFALVAGSAQQRRLIVQKTRQVINVTSEPDRRRHPT